MTQGRVTALSVLDRRLVDVSGVTVTVGGVVLAMVTLVLAGLVSVLLGRSIRRYGARRGNENRASLYTLSRIAQYTTIVLGSLLAVSLLGVPISRLAVFAGALGVGIGFGLQTVFSNFVSGLILLFDKSLKVGDFVELESGVHGEVRDIKIRATTIVTNDNIDILVPNSEFVGGRVVNWTHREVSRRLRVPFGVAYGTDKDLVKRAALEAAAQVPFTLALDGVRRPQVWLSEFGESALEFELVTWLTAEATKKPGAVKAAYNWALHTELQRYGIEIPFPQRDVNLRTLFGLDGTDALAALRLEPARDKTPRPSAGGSAAPST
ncbi:MAG: mechanosensitive ion channel domain-containing protein, partial [Nocardioidaceae bacterium]